MATKQYTVNYSTGSSKVSISGGNSVYAWGLPYSNTTYQTEVKKGVPPYSIITSAKWTLQAKRAWYLLGADGSAACVVRDSNGSVIKTFNETKKITTDNQSFSYELKDYIQSGEPNAGFIDNSLCNRFDFKVTNEAISSAVTYDFTSESRKMVLSLTLPTLTVTSAEGGTLSEQKTVDMDVSTSFTCTAIPNDGYRFSGWSDKKSTSATRTFTIEDLNDPNTIITAKFEPALYRITVSAGEGGTVSGTADYLYGEIATLRAYPEDGYDFKQWSDGNEENPRIFQVYSDGSYHAEFEKETSNKILVGNQSPQKIYIDKQLVKMVYIDKTKTFEYH